MSHKYKFRDQDTLYHVTFTVVYWLDVFIRAEYADLFLKNLTYCKKNKGLEVYAFCIMSSHIHLMLGRNGNQKLEDIIRDLKKYSAIQLIKAIASNPQESRKELFLWLCKRAGKKNNNNSTYQFWQQNSHPIELSSNAMIDQRLSYIHQNPVKAGFVKRPEDWWYSSASNYAGLVDKAFEVQFI